MISEHIARDAVSGIPPSQLPAIVVDVLDGTRPPLTGGGHGDDPAEDVFIQLLRSPDTGSETRLAVLAGCRQIFQRLAGHVDASELPEADRELLIRFCRLLDMAKPSELRGQAKALLTLAVESSAEPAVLAPTVRGALAYAATETDVPLWESVIQRREVAAYAFNALLQIDPAHARLESHLGTLWEKQFRDGWPVKAEFLALRLEEKSGADEAVVRVLSELKSSASDVWPQIASALEKSESGKLWLDQVNKSVRGFPTIISNNPILAPGFVRTHSYITKTLVVEKSPPAYFEDAIRQGLIITHARDFVTQEQIANDLDLLIDEYILRKRSSANSIRQIPPFIYPHAKQIA